VPALGHVRLGEDADELPVLLGHGQPPDLVLRHQPSGLLEALLWIDRDDVLRGDLADGGLGALAFGEDANREIAVGDDADEAVALDDRQRADVLGLHRAGGVCGGRVGIDRRRVRRHRLANGLVHAVPLPSLGRGYPQPGS
jgi:hypothetical protein